MRVPSGAYAQIRELRDRRREIVRRASARLHAQSAAADSADDEDDAGAALAPDASARSAVAGELAALHEEMVKLQLELIRDACDMAIPLARIRWLPFEISDGLVGLLGTISSLIGMYQVRPVSKPKLS